MMGLVLDLFPGLELLGRAFREAGFCVVSGPDKLWGEDVHDFHPPAGRFDGVIGGSPCQTFSALANLVRAKGLEPRFGNLIPEFERVVVEAAPLWFLHENVPAAPIPLPKGYSVKDFTLCNSSIPGEDGLGQEQERVRRFTFGVRMFDSDVTGTRGAANLLRWIPRAALRLPACQRTGAVSRDDTRGKRDRERGWGEPRPGRVRTHAVQAEVGGGGRSWPKGSRARQPGVAYDDGPGTRDRIRTSAVTADLGSDGGRRRTRQRAITGGGQNAGFPKEGTGGACRSIAEMLRLQGLPGDLLDDAPFTAKAKRKLVANGVPMPLGRAVARAVVKALEELAGSVDAAGAGAVEYEDGPGCVVRGPLLND